MWLIGLARLLIYLRVTEWERREERKKKKRKKSDLVG
jgi:hypothetical protein